MMIFFNINIDNLSIEEIKIEFKNVVFNKLTAKSFTYIQCQNYIYLIGCAIEYVDYFINDKDKILLLMNLYLDIIDNLIFND